MDKVLDFVRGCIRPFISVTGWVVFLAIVIIAIWKFMDAELAGKLAVGFLVAVTGIVNHWLGTRNK